MNPINTKMLTINSKKKQIMSNALPTSIHEIGFLSLRPSVMWSSSFFWAGAPSPVFLVSRQHKRVIGEVNLEIIVAIAAIHGVTQGSGSSCNDNKNYCRIDR